MKKKFFVIYNIRNKMYIYYSRTLCCVDDWKESDQNARFTLAEMSTEFVLLKNDAKKYVMWLVTIVIC